MGWWESSDGLMGDGPLDSVRDVLTSRWIPAHGKPTWRAFVDLLTTALREEQIVGEGGGVVVVRFEDGEPVVGALMEVPAPELEVAKLLVGSIAYWYTDTDSIDRPPTVHEVVGTVDSVVGASPRAYIADAGDDEVTLAVLA